MKITPTPLRHSRESRNPFLSQPSKIAMDSYFRGNDEICKVFKLK
jgi:hypothetical protein